MLTQLHGKKDRSSGLALSADNGCSFSLVQDSLPFKLYLSTFCTRAIKLPPPGTRSCEPEPKQQTNMKTMNVQGAPRC